MASLEAIYSFSHARAHVGAARRARLACSAIACAAAAILALAAPASLDWNQGTPAPPRAPAEALASPDVSAKFDDGFYDKIQGWIAGAGAGEPPAPPARRPSAT